MDFLFDLLGTLLKALLSLVLLAIILGALGFIVVGGLKLASVV